MHPAIGVGGRAHRIQDGLRHHDTSEREVPAGDPLGEGEDVGLDAVARQGEPVPGPPEPGDDLVRNEEDVVLGADLPDQGEVVVGRDDDPPRPLDGLGDEGGHRFGPLL